MRRWLFFPLHSKVMASNIARAAILRSGDILQSYWACYNKVLHAGISSRALRLTFYCLSALKSKKESSWGDECVVRNEKQERMRTAAQSSTEAKTDLINSMKTDQREKKEERENQKRNNIWMSVTTKYFPFHNLPFFLKSLVGKLEKWVTFGPILQRLTILIQLWNFQRHFRNDIGLYEIF